MKLRINGGLLQIQQDGDGFEVKAGLAFVGVSLNGVDLYEGDIVESQKGERKDIWLRAFGGIGIGKDDIDNWKIIGNIFDNYDLLWE